MILLMLIMIMIQIFKRFKFVKTNFSKVGQLNPTKSYLHQFSAVEYLSVYIWCIFSIIILILVPKLHLLIVLFGDQSIKANKV